MKTNQGFNYDPDKLAEKFLGEVNINDGFVAGCVG
jgi:hypothetical protein